LPGQGNGKETPGEERSKREVRADRILDATVELVQRWGYKKTTIDDIARLAGVAKGTVFLHWKTREALFEALLLREWLSAIADLKRRLESDPAGATLSALTRHMMSIVIDNPFFRGMMLGDTEMLGNLTRSSTAQNVMEFRLQMLQTYLHLLREKGLLRTDYAIETQLKMIAAIYTGFFLADQFLPSGYRFSSEEMIETMVQTLHRTLEPDEPASPAETEEVTQAFMHLLDQLRAAIENTSGNNQ